MKLKPILSLALAAGLGISLLSAAPTFAAGRSLTIKGSDTMVLAGQAWAEAFMAKYHGAEVSVQGGGSGTGIAALINGTCDICEASREMSLKEVQSCKERNFIPVKTTVALDGITIAVNSSNPVRSLTLAQLKGIFTGSIKNWKQVGGEDAPIVVLSRESSSGTYVYFKQNVLDNQNYAATALLMPSTKAIQQEVKHNPNAVGYGGVAYFKNQKGIKIVPVSKTKSSPAIEPTDDNVRSGRYPISRGLFFYTAGAPKGEIKTFVNFVLSTEGQELAEKKGYVSLKKM
jgi:phosphate transport system substrate-binding protein